MQVDPDITYLNDNAVDFSLKAQINKDGNDHVIPSSIDEISSMPENHISYDFLNLKTRQ